MKKFVLRFLPSGFIPMAFLIIFKIPGIFTASSACMAVFSPISIVLCGLGGVSFFIYLVYSKRSEELPMAYLYTLSSAYALSSYALANSGRTMAFAVFLLLPLIFLFYEAFLYEEKQGLFLILVLCAALCFDTVTTCILFLYLLLHCLIFSKKDFGGRIADTIHLAALFLSALFLSAIAAFPKLKSFFSYTQDIAYPDFHVNYDASHFLSRFLPGTFLGSFYTTGRAMDLYFTLGFFFLFICGLFLSDGTFRDKLKQIVYLLFIIGTLEFTPLQHVAELCADTNSSSLYYSFFLTFYLLKSTADYLPSLQAEETVSPKKRRTAIFAAAAALLLVLCGIIGAYHDFSALILAVIPAFAVLYTVCVSGFLFGKNRKLFRLFLPILITAELICNIILCTGSFFVPDAGLTGIDRYPWSKQAEHSISSLIPDYEAYSDFYSKHCVNRFFEAVEAVNSNVSLTDEEIKAYKPYGLLSVLDEFYLKSQKIETKKQLFVPIEISVTFSDSDLYDICEQGNHIFNLDFYTPAEKNAGVVVPFTCELPDEAFHASSGIVLYNNYSGNLYEWTKDTKTGYLYFSSMEPFSINFTLQAYQVDESALDLYAPALEQYITKHSSGGIVASDLLPFILTCVSVLILLFFTVNPDKKALYDKLKIKKDKLAKSPHLLRFRSFILANRIYLLAFFLPFAIYLTAVILYSSEPFGSKSFLDQDGYPSVLASILQAVYPYQEGNYTLSYNGGFYVSVFPGIYSLYHMLLALFDAGSIPGVLIITEGVLIGLSGFSVCYYLTHRFIRIKADKADYRLLIPALIYSLNTYMIAMHSYVYSWYLLFFLLPLLALALEEMLYCGKWLKYLLLLALCIGTNLNISLYICIYLVLHFFLCRFDSFYSFFKKGICFAAVSLLGAVCSFVNIWGVGSSLSSTGYAVSDSIRPTPGFYMSFFEQWKKFMFLTDYITTSDNYGEINLYMGTLTLVLCLIFFVFGRDKLSEKLRQAGVIILLLLSFNGRVLAYLWNGFHYPVSVANRFVFLLAFICALLSYEALLILKELSVKKAGSCFLSVSLFFTAAQLLSSGNRTSAFCLTLILLLLYFLLHVFFTRRASLAKYYIPVLIVIFGCEIAYNAWYNYGNLYLNDNFYYGDYQTIAEDNQKILDTDPDFSRFAFPSVYGENFGFIRNTPTINIFISTLGQSLQTANNYYGFYSGANFLQSNSDATPFGLSLSNTEFLQLPVLSTMRLRDLDWYEYLGFSNGQYVLRNPDVLSLGIYLPDFDTELLNHVTIHPIDFTNFFSGLYQKEEPRDLLLPIPLSLGKAQGEENTYCYLNKDRSYLDAETADELLSSGEAFSAAAFMASKTVYLSLTMTPEESGYVYLYANEFVSLGYHDAGETFTVVTEYPNRIYDSEKDFTCFTLREDVYREFIETARANQLEQVRVDKNRITAELDYEESGYTLMSLPYSSAWKVTIDGEPVETQDMFGAFLTFRTEKGKHRLEMVHDFSRNIRYNICILCILLILIAAYFAERSIKKRHSSFKQRISENVQEKPI